MGQVFAEVLDHLLEGHDRGPIPPSRTVGRVATSSLFAPLGWGPRAQILAAPRPFVVTTPPRPGPPPPRPRRRLSSRQQEAAEAFVQLGIPLRDDFTHDQLRRTFRALALRYHPDRHPGCGMADQVRLSARFAQLTDAYARLQTVFSSVH